MFGVRDPIPRGPHPPYVCSLQVFMYRSANPLGIYPHVCVSTWSVIRTLTFRHLQNSRQCRTLCSDECFSTLDHASTTLQLKIKEAIHIQ